MNTLEKYMCTMIATNHKIIHKTRKGQMRATPIIYHSPRSAHSGTILKDYIYNTFDVH